MPEKPYNLAVRAVIKNEQGQCLLVRRSNLCRSFAGKWEWPGGKVESGEPFDVGLLREIREETGLEVELTGVAGAYVMEIKNIRVAVLCMEASITAGTVRLSEEHDAFAWVPVAELLKWNIADGLEEFAKSYVATKTAK